MRVGAGAGMLGFPPGGRFVVLPRRPARAAVAGLALYDAVARRQEAALVLGGWLIRARLGGLLRLRGRAPLPDPDWWDGWVREVAVPRLGPLGSASFRLLGGGGGEPPRFTCLLCDGAGAPVAFAKVWREAGEAPLERVEAVLRRLEGGAPQGFRVPALLGSGAHRGRAYLLQAPMPAGHHRRMAPDPARLRGVIAEIQELLAPLPRPEGTPAGHVPVHGSLTPLNLRRAATGELWLVDWDKASWGPARSDEVRYWISDGARRGRGDAARRAGRVLERLGSRGPEVAEALAWRAAVRPQEVLAAEQAIRDRLMEAVTWH